MFSFAGAFRMARAAAGGEGAEILVLDAAVLAGVLVFLGAFVEFVLAFFGPTGMAGAGTGSEALH